MLGKQIYSNRKLMSAISNTKSCAVDVYSIPREEVFFPYEQFPWINSWHKSPFVFLKDNFCTTLKTQESYCRINLFSVITFTWRTFKFLSWREHFSTCNMFIVQWNFGFILGRIRRTWFLLEEAAISRCLIYKDHVFPITVIFPLNI